MYIKVVCLGSCIYIYLLCLVATIIFSWTIWLEDKDSITKLQTRNIVHNLAASLQVPKNSIRHLKFLLLVLVQHFNTYLFFFFYVAYLNTGVFKATTFFLNLRASAVYRNKYYTIQLCGLKVQKIIFHSLWKEKILCILLSI